MGRFNPPRLYQFHGQCVVSIGWWSLAAVAVWPMDDPARGPPLLAQDEQVQRPCCIMDCTCCSCAFLSFRCLKRGQSWTYLQETVELREKALETEVQIPIKSAPSSASLNKNEKKKSRVCVVRFLCLSVGSLTFARLCSLTKRTPHLSSYYLSLGPTGTHC